MKIITSVVNHSLVVQVGDKEKVFTPSMGSIGLQGVDIQLFIRKYDGEIELSLLPDDNVIGRINAFQDASNNWVNPTRQKIINKSIYETDVMTWNPEVLGFPSMTVSNVSVQLAEYRIKRETIHIWFQATCKIDSPGIAITASLPFPFYYPISADVPLTCRVGNPAPHFITGMSHIAPSYDRTKMFIALNDISKEFAATENNILQVSGAYRIK